MSTTTIRPLDLLRLAERLEFHDYQPVQDSGEIRAVFEGTEMVFRIMGGDEPWMATRAVLQARFADASYSRLLAVATAMNTEYFLPKVYPLPTPNGWTLRVEVLLDATAGLTDTQLDDHLGMAISTILAVLSQIEKLLS